MFQTCSISMLPKTRIQRFYLHVSACAVLQGKTISNKDKCKECKGQKTVKERKVLEVVISPGMKNGQKITFNGEADEAPGAFEQRKMQYCSTMLVAPRS